MFLLGVPSLAVCPGNPATLEAGPAAAAAIISSGAAERGNIFHEAKSGPGSPEYCVITALPAFSKSSFQERGMLKVLAHARDVLPR